MIGPRKKRSISDKHRKHSVWLKRCMKKLNNKYQIAKCSNCGADKLSHRVCEECGYYKGKQVVVIKTKSKEDVMDV